MSSRIPSWSRKYLEPLPRVFYHGLAVQKEAVFGFGPTTDDDTGLLLTISTVSMVATDQAETNFLTFPDKFLKIPDFSKSNS